MPFQLFPIPKTCKIYKEEYSLNSKKLIKFDPCFSDNLKEKVIALAEEISHLFNNPLKLTSIEDKEEDLFLKINHSSSLSPQEYTLTCTKNFITIESGDENGAFYGLQTLKQLINQTGSKIPKISIKDSPDFDQRGMMLDISRCKVPTMASLKKYVDLLASLKFNQLQLYTEHTFAYSKHETVWFDSSPMTAEQVLELDKYCQENYIELVPNFNSFGHFGRWLKHPEYRHLAECPEDKNPGVLYPDKRSLDFIDSLYKEMLPNFTSKLFNIGCDETWELGQGKSKEMCEKETTEKVYFDFLVKLADLVKKHKRQMMFWGDIILKQPELIKQLPKDIIALNWGYNSDHPYNEECPKFAAAGIPFYVCPGTSSWNSIIGNWQKARKNLANAAVNGFKNGAAGYLITDWGDGGHHQYLPISYPGILTGACFSWNYQANKDVDTAKGLDLLIFQDQKRILGKLLLDIAEIHRCIPVKNHNCTAFNLMLFRSEDSLKKEFGNVSEKCFDGILAKIENCRTLIKKAKPSADDGQLIKEEIDTGLEIAKFATQRAKAILWPKKADKSELKHKLEHIIRLHEELWLSRNRHGGLRESSDRLRKLFANFADND